MSSGWSVEVTEAGVVALRSLARDERTAVAERIESLAREGLPRALGAEAAERGSVRVRVGDHADVCVEDRSRRTLYVVALRGERTPAATALRPLARNRMARWWNDWMGGDGMGWMTQELRFAARSLRRSPGFTTVAVLTLALGVSDRTAAISSVAKGVILAHLPYEDPERVVTVWASWDNFPDKAWLSLPEYQLFHQESRSLEDLALYAGSTTNFTTPANPEGRQVVGLVVRQGMTMALAGVVVGTVVAWFASNLMAGLLYDVTPQDPLVFVAVPALFAVVALLACWIPAARASRVRPATVLRYE